MTVARVWSGETALVCIGADADRSLVKRIEHVLGDGDESFESLLGALTDGGLEHVPDFLCVVAEPGGVRVVLRGSFSVEVATEGGAPARIDGGGARTWREELFREARTVRPLLSDLDLVWYAPSQVHEPMDHQSTQWTGEDPSADEDATLAEPAIRIVEDELAHVEPEKPQRADDDFDFSNLLEHTRYRDVEAAAVRQPEPTPEPSPSTPPPVPPPPPDEVAVEPSPDGAHDRGSEPASQAPSPPASGLISGVPGMADAGSSAEIDPASEGAPGPASIDDDGHTISIGELRRMQDASAPASSVGSGVQALRCAAGHDNPPTAVHCRLCGSEIVDRSIHLVARPVVARLRFSNGTVVELDKPQLIGRKPTVETSTAGEPPGLVTVPSPDGSISRVHVAVHVAGWDVLVEDCGSTNGTQIRLPGKDPERLREHEPRLVIPGTAVGLSDAIEFTVEVPHP